ncbi:MAG: hypothetical protein DHS20C11_19670 [Lysobacteraceae bacterium]|nr:MAG: hypothetical protein DHS20C11_19670 [Xanthomonadaceae bacterium]
MSSSKYQQYPARIAYVFEDPALPMLVACVDGDGNIAPSERVSGEQLADWADGHAVHVVASGLVTTCAWADLPTRNRTQLVQAAPYAVEDRIAQEVDALHVAVGTWRKGQAALVCCIRRDWVESVLAMFERADVHLAHIWAAQGLMADGVSGLQMPDCVLVSADSSVFALPPDCLDVATAALEGQVVVANDDSGWPLSTASERSRSVFQSLVPEVIGGVNRVDLLQGDYQQRATASDGSRWWRRVAVVAAVGVVLNLAMAGIEVWRLDGHADRLRVEAEQTLKEAFPAIRPVDPVVQMQQGLAAVQSSAGGASGFLGLIRGAGVAIARNPRLRVDSIDYRNGQLELALIAGSIADLDDMASQIEQTTGLDAELLATTSGPDGVRGRVRVATPS